MIRDSELILNRDDSVFHLHLKPENISDQIILVGDPGRVDSIAELFDKTDFSVQNREFKTVTGWFNNKKLSVISTGIGTDNIDIVLNELDAIANIDLKTREVKSNQKSLDIIRIGTSGGLQNNLPVNSYVVSRKAIGLDGLLHFYADNDKIRDKSFEIAFKDFTNWPEFLPAPYVVDASKKLIQKFENSIFKIGATITAPGFYGPQGRVLRLGLSMPHFNELVENFSFEGLKIANFEMESSAIYGLSRMLGHNALTVCLIIANRVTKKANENYREEMKKLIIKVLDHLTK